MAMSFVKLPSGGLMPSIGFGTWKVRTDVENIITKAITAGYRHIDTAYVYKNEKEIGKALFNLFDAGVVKREEMFIVSKLYIYIYLASIDCSSIAHRQSKVSEYLKKSLEDLKMTYVDLYLIHSPLATLEKGGESGVYPSDKEADITKTWKGMEDVYNAGLAKSIGLSNFNSEQITRILNSCSVKPENLQVECHVYLQQKQLHKFCQEHNITFTAYSPIGRPALVIQEGLNQPILLEDLSVKAIANKHSKTPAQILIRFLLQQQMVTIPKSVNEGRMKENFETSNFSLEEEDMESLMKLDKGVRYVKFNKVSKQTDHPEYPFKAEL